MIRAELIWETGVKYTVIRTEGVERLVYGDINDISNNSQGQRIDGDPYTYDIGV